MTKLGNVVPGLFSPNMFSFKLSALLYPTLHLPDIIFKYAFESLIVYRLYSSRTLCHIKEKPFIVKKDYAYFFLFIKHRKFKKKKTFGFVTCPERLGIHVQCGVALSSITCSVGWKRKKCCDAIGSVVGGSRPSVRHTQHGILSVKT